MAVQRAIGLFTLLTEIADTKSAKTRLSIRLRKPKSKQEANGESTYFSAFSGKFTSAGLFCHSILTETWN